MSAPEPVAVELGVAWACNAWKARAVAAWAALGEQQYHHAACLSIAEGAPGWQDFDAKYPAAQAVKALRAEVERLNEIVKAAIAEGLTPEARMQAIREAREAKAEVERLTRERDEALSGWRVSTDHQLFYMGQVRALCGHGNPHIFHDCFDAATQQKAEARRLLERAGARLCGASNEDTAALGAEIEAWLGGK